MQQYCVIDFETFSAADLKKVGAYNYAIHPSTQVLCVAWKVGTKEMLPHTQVFLYSPLVNKAPLALLTAVLKNPNVLKIAHNAFFEQVVCRFVLGVDVPISEWVCTASLAAALALPRKLAEVGAALNLTHQKDDEGHRVMLKLSKPRKPTLDDPRTRHCDRADYEKLFAYCVADIQAETDLFLALCPLIPSERKLWELDQKINWRGFRVDLPLISKCLGMIDEENANLQSSVQKLSGGQLKATTQRDATLRWLAQNGAEFPDLKAKTVADALASGAHQGIVRDMLSLRADSSKTSTAKFQAFKQRMGPGERLRDILVFHGASTGRFTGSGVQVQNFPRGTVKGDMSLAAELVLDPSTDLEMVRTLYGKPLDLFSSLLRSCIVPTKGCTLFGGDFAGIEVRVLFWLANYDSGLEAFRQKRDLYREIATKIYGVSLDDVTKEQREVGKRAVLGCLAEDTPVLTRSGFKPIQLLNRTDRIWDGLYWEKHGGVVRKGLKDVIRIDTLNIESTPDHWFLQNGMWRTAVEIVSAEDIRPLNSAQKTETLSSRPLSLSAGPKGVSVCAAYAELKKNLGLIFSGKAKDYFAEIVRSQSPLGNSGDAREIVTSYLIENLENVGRLVSITSKSVVKNLVTKTSTGMVLEESNSNSGPLENFWNSLLRCAGLTNGASRWTELITTGVMNPETYESLRKKLTTKIVQTYDIQNAGPHNRFQVSGVIAHNSGYGMGHVKFRETCKAFGIEVSENLARTAVDAYRTAHEPVVTLWNNLERVAMEAIRNPGKRYKIHHTTWWVQNKFLWCKLPSGRCLAYYGPTIKDKKTPWGEMKAQVHHYDVNPKTKKWELASKYGGAWTENLCQAIARDLMTDAMFRTDAAGYETLITVHDELLTEHPKGNEKEFEDLMSAVPTWCETLPLKVETWSGKRYRK